MKLTYNFLLDLLSRYPEKSNIQPTIFHVFFFDLIQSSLLVDENNPHLEQITSGFFCPHSPSGPLYITQKAWAM